MKTFKKIYLEITNACNLNCDFCIKNKREIKFLNKNEFIKILNKLKGYTDYLYFHLLGEPLLHPKINDFIDIASKNFNINITTNGYLINKIKHNKNIRQINISLHSYNERYGISITDYLNNVFDSVDELITNKTYISLRLWIKNKYAKRIIDYINNRYNLQIPYDIDNYKINDFLFINNFHEFIWPDLNNSFCEEKGTCYALKDHIGILVDGTVVPCCLDSLGIINLGNIYQTDLDNIIKSNRFIEMKEAFNNKVKKEELCKHCKFIEK